LLILACAVLVSTEAKLVHRDLHISLCSDTDEEDMYGLDGEEVWHADFSQGKGVMTLPEFADSFRYEEYAYQKSVSNLIECQKNLAIFARNYNYPAERRDAPQTSIYSKADVELGSNNTLICYVTGFYPPHIEVSWMKNNVTLTDEATLSRYYINHDLTFKAVSTLSFTPKEGDIYTCTVEHMALDRPLTNTWVNENMWLCVFVCVQVRVPLPSVFWSVLCGVGVAAGLLLLAVAFVILYYCH
ncbi:hypothetical protein NFI96_019615, partial [Prochilodus magdalenae]